MGHCTDNFRIDGPRVRAKCLGISRRWACRIVVLSRLCFALSCRLLTLTEEDADDFEAVVVVDGLGDLDLGSGAPNSLDAESKTETMDNVDNVDVIEQKMDTAAIEQMLQAFTAHSGSLESIHRCIQVRLLLRVSASMKLEMLSLLVNERSFLVLIALV